MRKIEDLKLCALEKGYKLSYCEKSKGEKSGNFDGYDHHYRDEAFSEDDQEKAIARFKELCSYSDVPKEKVIKIEVEKA